MAGAGLSGQAGAPDQHLRELRIEGSTGEAAFEWKDPGICAVASFDDMLAAI